MHKSFLHLRKFLDRESSQFLGAGLARGQQGGDDTPAFVGNRVAVGLGYFADQSVGSQQDQAASDCRCLATQQLRVIGRLEKFGSDVSVAESIQGELPPINYGQELAV